jgi:hypothetical protein
VRRVEALQPAHGGFVFVLVVVLDVALPDRLLDELQPGEAAVDGLHLQHRLDPEGDRDAAADREGFARQGRGLDGDPFVGDRHAGLPSSVKAFSRGA